MRGSFLADITNTAVDSSKKRSRHDKAKETLARKKHGRRIAPDAYLNAIDFLRDGKSVAEAAKRARISNSALRRELLKRNLDFNGRPIKPEQVQIPEESVENLPTSMNLKAMKPSQSAISVLNGRIETLEAEKNQLLGQNNLLLALLKKSLRRR